MTDDIKNPCSESLTSACFAQYPKWAKMVLAIRLLFLLFPPKLSRYLFNITGIFPIDPSFNLPPWLFEYPQGFYPPTMDLPGEPSYFPPLPPGDEYPFQPPPGDAVAPVDPSGIDAAAQLPLAPGDAVAPVDPSGIDAAAQLPLAPGFWGAAGSLQLSPMPPPWLSPGKAPPIRITVFPLPTWSPDEGSPIPDFNWRPPPPPKPTPKPLSPLEAIIPLPPQWLWPPAFGPPHSWASQDPDTSDPTLLYYEPFQGLELCAQQVARWYIDFYFPRRATYCPSLPLDHSYFEPATGNTNRIRMSYAEPKIVTIVNSGGGPSNNDQPVIWSMYDFEVATNAPPYKMFKILFDADISLESWNYSSWLVLHIRKSGPPNNLNLHFILAIPDNYSVPFPEGDENDIYVDWTEKSGVEQIVDLRDWYPGDGYAVNNFYFKADIAGGADLLFNLHYFDFYL